MFEEAVSSRRDYGRRGFLSLAMAGGVALTASGCGLLGGSDDSGSAKGGSGVEKAKIKVSIMPTIDVAPVPETKTVKNRLHLDLRADGTSTAAELGRLAGLGAHPVDVGQPADASWVTLADPEGNEFCLLSRTVQETR